MAPACPKGKASVGCFLIGQWGGDLFPDWARKVRPYYALMQPSWVFPAPFGVASGVCGGEGLRRGSLGKQEGLNSPGRRWHFTLAALQPGKPQQANRAKAAMKIKQGNLLKSNKILCLETTVCIWGRVGVLWAVKYSRMRAWNVCHLQKHCHYY